MFRQEERVQLIAFRMKHDINQHDFARGIISRNQLSNIESGKSSTTEKVLFQVYLRLCEYMIILGDYKRPEYLNLQHHPAYKKLQRALDFYEFMESESLQRKELVDGCLELNHSNFGLVGTIIYEKTADQFIKKNDLDSAMLFYLKAFYTLGSCNRDHITYQYMEKLIRKIALMAKSDKRHFALIELYDHLMYIQEDLKLEEVQKDYLFDLAVAYKSIEADEKAIEICKKIVAISLNEGNLSYAVLGKTYHMLAQYQRETGQLDLSKRSYIKASELTKRHGTLEEFEIIQAEIASLNEA